VSIHIFLISVCYVKWIHNEDLMLYIYIYLYISLICVKNVTTQNLCSNTNNTQPDATINHAIYCLVAQTLLNMFRALLCPSSGAISNCSLSLRFPYECRGACVSSHMKTGGCDCSLKELLMMGITMPETCWAASVRLSNKLYDWLLHLFGCFYLNIWRCTEPQTLNSKFVIFQEKVFKYFEVL
jgi:hypothetical protein